MLCAQSIDHLRHAKQTAISESSSLMTGSLAHYGNPAALLHDLPGWHFSLSHHNTGLTDIRAISGSFTRISDNYAFGGLVGSYGIEGFQERQGALSFSRRIGQGSYLGIQANYGQLQIQNLGSTTAFDLSVGYFTRLSERFVISTYFLNPFSALDSDSRLTGKVELSSAYTVSSKLELYTSVRKRWRQETSISAGLSYLPYEILELYTSWESSPNSMSFGFSLELGDQWYIHSGLNTHPILGSSLTFSLDYRL